MNAVLAPACVRVSWCVWVCGMLLVLTGACFSDRQSPTTSGSTGTCRIPVGSEVVGAVQAVVAIREFQFFPDTLRVPRGTTVTWVNCEEDFANEPHTASHDTGDWGSPEMSPTDVFSRRFAEPGVYRYFCEPHPFMSGTLIVE
jgi:plastocyanin